MTRFERLWLANLRAFIAVYGTMEGNWTPTPTTVSRVGMGSGIAIAVGAVLLVTFIVLSCYACHRANGRGRFRRATVARGANGTIIQVTAQDPEAAIVVTGLEQATLDSYPKFVYSEEVKTTEKGDLSCCSICLGDYKDSDLLRRLPDCSHAFHVACIDAWMRMHATCPMCRTSPLPSPLSTPLSEVVPLARHFASIQR